MDYIGDSLFAGYFPSKFLQVAPGVSELCEGCQHLLSRPPAQLFTPSAPHIHCSTLSFLIPHHWTETAKHIITHLKLEILNEDLNKQA